MKKISAILLAFSLLASVATYMGEAGAEEVEFIPIDLSETENPEDFPFGIECGDPEFIYVTIFGQGLLAKISKNTREVVELINDPLGPGFFDQGFFGIARDLGNPDEGRAAGKLFINEIGSGQAWRFDPSAAPETAWTLITLAEGAIDFQSQGIVFANDFVWITLTYTGFSGVIRVDPETLEVTPFEIPGGGFLASLNVDALDDTMLWIADRGVTDPETGATIGDKVYKFSTVTGEVVQTIPLSNVPFTADHFSSAPLADGNLTDGSEPFHIDSDANFIYVALNEFNPGVPVTEDGPFSLIAKIPRFTEPVFSGTVGIINTGAPNFDFGTFTVFVPKSPDGTPGDLLVWTDQSGHVGTIDLTGEDSPSFTFTGLSDDHHFGCELVGNDDIFRFAFASHGSAKVGIQPNSKFSVGGLKRPSGHGGSDPVARSTSSPFGESDAKPPVIGQVITSSGSLKISAQITDDVGVRDANVIIGKKVYAMQPHNGNPLWWDTTVPSEDLPSGEVFFKIVARDFGLNTAQYEGSAESTGATGGGSQQGPLFVTVPLAEGVHNSAYSIVASGITQDITQDTKTMSLQVTIKNTSSEPLKNIRIVLSPELKGKFLLSDYAIKNIDPNSEYTISLKLNGKPNVDVRGEPIPYNGRIIISVDNKSPYILELSGAIPNESAALQSLFMKNIASKGEQRYKSFVKPEERISQAEYDVKLGSGESVIKSTSDELIITNTGDKPLKNLRIMTSSSADHFIPEQKNIQFLPAGSFVKIKLVSKMNDAITKDLSGAVIIAPENAVPVTVPVSISKQLVEDKNSMYEIRTISGNNMISNTADGIVIRNNSDESIDNVRLILPQQLARVFSLSQDSFRSIEPNSEATVYLQARGSDTNVKQILNDYRGEMIIVSSDGMKKVIPINIVWKGISSEHFVINARDNAEELAKATQVINFLERSYGETSKLIGKVETKTVIYMTSSLDELKMLSNALTPSTYVYAEDVGFVWSNSEDVNMLALKQFTYRTIVQNYATYWTKQKISLDKGNWLVDGISDYVTASIVGERGMVKNNLEAFIAEPVSFEWYGQSTQSQHGASYTLFKYFADKYGETVIDKILNNLGSTIMNSNRCDTLEQCVLVKAVYDINGLNMNDKRHETSFATIMQEWKQYLQDEYGINGLN